MSDARNHRRRVQAPHSRAEHRRHHRERRGRGGKERSGRERGGKRETLRLSELKAKAALVFPFLSSLSLGRVCSDQQESIRSHLCALQASTAAERTERAKETAAVWLCRAGLARGAFPARALAMEYSVRASAVCLWRRTRSIRERAGKESILRLCVCVCTSSRTQTRSLVLSPLYSAMSPRSCQ